MDNNWKDLVRLGGVDKKQHVLKNNNITTEETVYENLENVILTYKILFCFETMLSIFKKSDDCVYAINYLIIFLFDFLIISLFTFQDLFKFLYFILRHQCNTTRCVL